MNHFARTLAIVWLCIGIAAAQDGAITLDDVIALLATRTDEAEILRFVKNADSLRLAPGFEKRLQDAGAGEALVAAIKEAYDDDVVSRVLEIVAAGGDDVKVLTWIGENGRRRALTAQDKVRLARGKATPKMILAIEGGYVLQGYRLYRDDLGMFSIQLPADWKDRHEYTEGGINVDLSPEEGGATDKFKTGVNIQIAHLEKGKFGVGQSGDLLTWVRRTLPAYLRLNRSLQETPAEGEAGQARWQRMRGLRVVTQDFTRKMNGVACRARLVRFNYDDLHYGIFCVAPQDQFAAKEETFKRMILSFLPYPDRLPAARRRVRLEPNEALDLYRKAVVLVKTSIGTGSGFFVRPDGYVLTNHHVVCSARPHVKCDDPANHKVSGPIKLIWDAKAFPARQGEDRREIEAVFVDTVYSHSPKIDLALLKVPNPPEAFATIPVAPIASGVPQEGDPVVALGFPFPGLHGLGNLFLTSGAITRFNYIDHPLRAGGDRRDLDDLFTDAEINCGNSGGPCVDLVTGTVVGLNTYANTDPTNEARELLYAGVVAIDHALDLFPQLRWYPAGRVLKAADHLELGAMLLTRRFFRAAEQELARARAEAKNLTASERARLDVCRFRLAQETGLDGRSHLEAALAADPKCVEAWVAKADALVIAKDRAGAIDAVNRAIQADPDDWKLFHRLADLYRQLGKAAPAEEALKKAFQLAGNEEPRLHALKGRLSFLNGKWDEGIEACRLAVRLDAADETARLALAEGLQNRKNTAAAVAECEAMIRDYPEAAKTHFRLGTLLMDQAGRKDEAFGHLAMALGLMNDRGEQPDKLNLKYICMNAEPGRHPDLDENTLNSLYFQAASTLLKAEPKEAHDLLAPFWARLGFQNLEKIHAHLAKGAGEVPPLEAEDLDALLALECPMRTLNEVLGATSLGFPVTTGIVKLLRDKHLKVLLALLQRQEEDQLAVQPSLKSFLSVRWGGLTKIDADPARRTLIVKNTAPFPLTEVSIMLTYPDAAGPAKSITMAPQMADPVLQAGEEREVEIAHPKWAELEKLGVKKLNVALCQAKPAAARNALYLGQLAVRGEMTKDGYLYKVTNASSFNVSALTLRGWFLNAQGEQLVGANGIPLSSWASATFPSLLGPGMETEVIVVKEWVDPAWLARNGIPAEVGQPSVEVKLVGAKIQRE